MAVRIPDEVRAQLAEVQRQLKSELRDVAWTRPEAMHLTLQFLGNIESARVQELEWVLAGAARKHTPFELALGALGSFNDRVLWIGLERGSEPLQRLAEDVRIAAKEFSEHEENRTFNGHVTLGRCRRPVRRSGALLRNVRVPKFQPWTATGFELFRSELSPQGSRYTTLAEIAVERGTPMPRNV